MLYVFANTRLYDLIQIFVIKVWCGQRDKKTSLKITANIKLCGAPSTQSSLARVNTDHILFTLLKFSTDNAAVP